MRKTNKQFTEEVFRRSEVKIEKENKRKKRLVTIAKSMAACLVFFVALGVTPYLWENGATNNSGVENEEFNEVENQNPDEESAEEGNLLLSFQAADLMEGIEPEESASESLTDSMLDTEALNSSFVNNQMDLSVKLFQQSVAKTSEENTLISPLSISLALAMTANGADGTTLEEMERLLAGNNSMEELNSWFHSYVNKLPSDEEYKLSIANSLWFRDDDRFTVEKDFLQTNANYYGASIYKSPFDETTVADINYWVNQKTDGMIDKMVDNIDEATLMYLINAVCFDAAWEESYSEKNVKEGSFTSHDGQERVVDMMYSTEFDYLEDDSVTGFIKDYEAGKYSFVALLPKENVTLEDYIRQLDGADLQALLSNKKKAAVKTVMPKFSYEYEVGMVDVLENLGISLAFDANNADFSGIGTAPEGNIYIGDVRHKTFIEVDEDGTRAAAATSVAVQFNSAGSQIYQVELNRPFMYMIIDNETNLPIFMGTMLDTEG